MTATNPNDNRLQVRLSPEYQRMVAWLAKEMNRSSSDAVRQCIYETYVRMQKENPMKTVKQVAQDIAKARGGCIAVRVYDVNGSGNIEAEIDPAAAKYCPCEFCKAGDLTTSA